MPDDSRQKAWMASASRLRRRVNLGWWYQEMSWPLISLAILAAFLVVAFRFFEVPLFWLHGLLLGLSVISIGIFAWFRSATHRLSREDALVRMEADLGLHNSLTTAFAGRGAWPDPGMVRPVVKWRFGQLVYPLTTALAVLVLAFLIPIAPAHEDGIENQPYTWTRLEAEVEQLAEEEVIDQDYADEIKKRLDDLRKQKAEEWFSASSLEATDSLQQAHTREASRLERDLMRFEKSLQKAADPQATREQREHAAQQMQEALEGMRNGQMKPNKELLKKLKEAAEKGAENLPGEQREDLEKRLREMAERLGEGNEQEQEPGGIDKGPGSFPDLFGQKSPDLPLKKFEQLDGQDDEEPDPGDLLNLEEIEHEIDRSQKDATTSGAAESEGSGGDRVWKDALDPDEQKSLKSFFE